ncbi:phosphatidate cytidylyltransferase [Thalassotalea ponticola]|uniref:phosphatidate cytidylyltransferase n=1 Tax=Thalassotalea ponticola TaxID=1523392 RepID=UPI0025B2D34C|nr:phosphatidate cytidylyltransferase [Thalassotalea ponticola]MDN3652550.1 phosphatidate cytidylyltransferase [Thalassotalea ponticola]
MLKQRIITAAVLAPLAIAAIFFLSLQNFAAVLAVVLAIGAWEWGPLMGFDTKTRRIGFVSALVLAIVGVWYLVPPETIWSSSGHANPWVIVVMSISTCWWLISAMMISKYPKHSNFWTTHRSIRGIFGLLTLVPTWLAFLTLRSNDYPIDEYHGSYLILLLFALVWSADIGAYFTGKRFGKHKLMPNVSPGKTIEGFIGGMVCASVVAAAIALFFGSSAQQLTKMIVLAVVVSTVSVIGDLTESMLKRQAGVKDSGRILPGHGGVLDRIDSLTATAPIFALCLILFTW